MNHAAAAHCRALSRQFQLLTTHARAHAHARTRGTDLGAMSTVATVRDSAQQ